MNFQFFPLVDQPSLWMTPLVVMSFLLLARQGRDEFVGFLCGLPYASAALMHAIAQQHGDLGAIVAARSAIVVQCGFTVTAALIAATLSRSTERPTVASEPKQKIGIVNVFVAGVFTLAACIASISFGAKVGGFMAGIPFGTLCVFTSLCAYRGRSAAYHCARGYVVGQMFTITFMATLALAAPEIGFRAAFFASLILLVALVGLRCSVGAFVARDKTASARCDTIATIAPSRR